MMAKKINVAVIMGGKSPEHEISLISGKEVVKSLNKKKYNPLPVIISKEGTRWRLVSTKNLLRSPEPLSLKGTSKELVVADSREISGAGEVAQRGVQIAFIAMHGPFGEDGTVQGLLELAGIPYTGSGVLASALGMDKIMFRRLLAGKGIPIPKYIVVRREEKIPNLNRLGKYPYFVKPFNQGSSVGAAIVKNKSQLIKALKLAFKYSDLAIIDEYLSGLEVTCSVLGNADPFALPVIEIRPLKGEFFDYESKYTESGAEEIVPARISKALTLKVQKLAVAVYELIGAKGFARVDFILKENKKPCVLEINTIPGLTPMSLLPKAAKAAGISYAELLSKIIEYARK